MTSTTVRPADLVCPPRLDCDPSRLDLHAYDDFLAALCGRRDYQADAIRHAVAFLLGGRYTAIDDLVDEVWADPGRADLHTHYGTRDTHLSYTSFPGRLAATLDLATATGKSYVLYGVARIALNEGVDVRRVLVVVPSIVIRNELRRKFTELLADPHLNALLPPRPNAVAAPTLVGKDETVGDGCICIENRDQVYAHVNSSIRPSFAGTGTDTLVLNDEAHHVYDDADAGGNDATGWHTFLADDTFGFHRILGVSGTCFTTRKAPYEYFADVLYRFSVRQAMEGGFVKQVAYIKAATGQELKSDSALYQRAIHQMHEANRRLYGPYIKPLTIVVCQSIAAAKKARDRFVAWVAANGDPNIANKVLVVSSSRDDAADRRKLRDIETPASPHEYVFSVSMLTEGWDAKGVFLIVPYDERTFDSHLLVAQVLGRGLRIPAVAGIPAPVVRVLNHTSWASKVAGLVADVLESPEVVPLSPRPAGDPLHFTVDVLVSDRTTSIEDRPATEVAPAADSEQLLRAGVDLVPQRSQNRAELTVVNATTGREAIEQVATTGLKPVAAAAAEQFSQLRREARNDDARLEKVEAAGRSAVEAFIRASLRRSNITGPAAAGLSPVNEARIRAGLLACFPVSKAGERQPLLSTVTVTSHTERLEERPTSTLATRDVRVDRIRDPKTGVAVSAASRAQLDVHERRRLSAAIAGKARAEDVPDWQLRSPVTFVLTSHEPEWQFVKALLRPANVKLIESWVKSPDQGFVEIPYVHAAGSRNGQRSLFNPDFILRVAGAEGSRPHVLLVETKAEGDDSDENRDKVTHAEAYVERLNALLAAPKPTYSFHLLTPADYLDFFDALRAGTAAGYVGELHQQLRVAGTNTEGTDDGGGEDGADLEEMLDSLASGGWEAVG